jgi:steroid delta-isomerase-like uncharacterized protein
VSDAAATIRAYLDAFNAGDRAAMLALLTDDIAHDVSQGARETGRDAFAAFLARMDRCYREELRDILVMASGDRGAAEFVVHGTYLATDAGLPEARGQRYVLPAGAFFALRQGRIARVTMHYNLRDWIAQVSQ